MPPHRKNVTREDLLTVIIPSYTDQSDYDVETYKIVIEAQDADGTIFDVTIIPK